MGKITRKTPFRVLYKEALYASFIKLLNAQFRRTVH